MTEHTTQHADVNGTSFTDADVDRWAAETEQGYTGKHLGPSVPGRPISVGAQAKPFTLRLDAARRAKLDDAAQARHITPSQLMRDLIDAL
ncbi:ribbon-helix-helix domain-containing protein [Brachybacterium muris]|uniref:ribbon-helix-helix domain-containing protein n=1 Tax=Brachybacterium muris TaxID=219301 RepID=UPI000DB05DCE|nr:CopG family transcriptional regulator [Brachybacterium muris]PZP14445.1 MAG: DNA polymerase II [Brachybacterium faecium]MCT1654552.1 ribbon-helix-helix domain-containing protein [Brachybacterium muris]MCT1998359.1 ribbon-helix-helix domain-containing protein [Brachybacterium muris]MCT2177548.1 ribbon-helix-helix domain-containing protein [Brachybacterium muris]MCT2262113.1 ribbon-helix-helix domain-containing protein [Brachybacterium muris]